RDRGVSAGERLEVPGKFGPARKAVPSRDEKLRVSQPAACRALILLLELVPAPLHAIGFEADPLLELGRDFEALQPGNVFYPLSRPVADSAGIGRLASALEVSGEVCVVFEVWKGRKR